ncbi:MAG: hypothetical protein JSU59_03160 [Nitrospirota bacterium]|nr:MAG: hypothetical protein JSU59_03160 [Nitrospirota bacterium]
MSHIIRRTGIVFLLLIVAFGCGAHRLKQAQDSYNEAARIEVMVSFEEVEPIGDPLKGDAQALRNYRLALALTDEALEKYPTSLKKDQLYGTALMLKALCQWRIVALDKEAGQERVREIVTDIEGRLGSEEITLGTRDRVLLKALPGLREHALGMQQSDPKKAGDLFDSSLETLENSLATVNPPADHPVRAYIRLAQMRTLRAWRWVEFPNRPNNLEERKKWNENWNERYAAYRTKLAPLMEANRGLRDRVEKMDKDFGYQH